MTHEQIQERLGEWLDGELSSAESADASRHIDACQACKADALRLRRLSSSLFMAPAPADPRATEAFVARVMGRLEAETVSPWERFAALWLAPAFGLALAALIFTIASPRVDADTPLGVAVTMDADAVLGVAP